MVSFKPIRRYIRCNLYVIRKRKEIIKNASIETLVPLTTELILNQVNNCDVSPYQFISTHIESYLMINFAFLLLNSIKMYNESKEEIM